MRRYFIIFLFLSVLSCTKRYAKISEDQLSSVDERSVTIYMNAVSMPSIDSPYIVVDTKEIVRILNVYEHKAIEKKPFLSAIAPFSIVGIIPGILIIPTGYVVLGKDIIGFTIGTLFVGRILSCPDKEVSRHTKERYFKERIPCDKEFILAFCGKDFSRRYQPDNKGLLKINIMDFAPVYKENQDFEFKLVSPNGDSLDLIVPTNEISSLFLKGNKE
jgi:hypothetical protein